MLLGLLIAASVIGGDTVTRGDDGNGRWVIKEGRYVRLVTDFPDSDSLTDWVAAFDAAVPLWAEYWNRDASSLNGWRITAYVMADKSKFIAAGTLPRSLPDFRHGYQVGDRVWIYHQPQEYYNRHLLLHEGSHAITSHLLGGSGPPWFMEGTAEWMSTHLWQPANTSGRKSSLTIGMVPATPDNAKGWGRIELIESGRKQNRVPTIDSVMRYSDVAHREVEPYAWSWLAVTLMEMYPEYRNVLRDAASNASDRSPQFNRELFGKLRNEWPVLAARWNLLACDIDYGWDSSSQSVDLPMSLVPINQPTTMQLATNHAWQAAPMKLLAGQTVQVTSSGRYVIRKNSPRLDIDDLDSLLLAPPDTAPQADHPIAESDTAGDWYCEPEGITIHYYKGRPIGQLIARLLPMNTSTSGPHLSAPNDFVIGGANTVTAKEDCWLLFKVNEAPGDYWDNVGELVIELKPAN